MNLGLEKKVVLIAGASRGIGAATSRAFADEGAMLALLSRGQDDLNRLVEELKVAHPHLSMLTMNRDATEPGCAEAVVAEVEKRFDRLDVLVNCAGAGLRRSFEELSEGDWTACLDLNLMSAIRFSRAALPVMKKNGGGRIINLGALSATRPKNGQIASNVAKAGLINFTRSLAMEVAAHNILVNAVCPGSVEGSRWRESSRDAVSRSVPLGRPGKPEEVAGLIVFLSGVQSSYMTGAVIDVDGGLGAGLAP